MSAALLAFADAWWSWMAAMSLQAGALVLLVALLDRALARRVSPALLTALWSVVLVKLVLPPTLSSPLSLARLAGPKAPAALFPAPPARPLAVPVLALVWAGGVLVAGGLSLARHRRFQRALRVAPALPLPERFETIAIRAAARLGLKRLPEIRPSDAVRGPAVAGVRRPVVLVPVELVEDPSGERIEHALLHELAHVRRGDPLGSLAASLLAILYWFHPLVWLARSRLETLREVGCDRAVLAAVGGDPAAYRRTLLGFARDLLETSAAERAPATLGFLPRRSQLLARLAWLERTAGRPSRLGRASAALLVAGLVACALPLAPPRPAAPIDYVPPPLAELRGCLQLRFAVHAMLASEERASLPATPSRP